MNKDTAKRLRTAQKVQEAKAAVRTGKRNRESRRIEKRAEK